MATLLRHSSTTLSAAPPVARTGAPTGLPRVVIWGTILLLSGCYFMLGHDVRRSLLVDDGFNAEAAEMQTQVEEGSNTHRAAFIGIGLIGMGVLALFNGPPLRLRNGLALAVLATYGICLASVIWSDLPSLTVRRLVVLTCCFCAAVAVSRHFQARDICLLAFVFCGAASLVGFAAEVALRTFQPWVADYRFAGTVHPNTQAIQLAILLLSSFMLGRCYPQWRYRMRAVIVAALLLLLLTKSRTAVAGCAAAFVATWLLDAPARHRVGVFTLGVILGGFGLVALLAMGVDDPQSFKALLLLGRGAEDPQSLTGRIPLWQFLWEYVTHKPWTGYGFGTFWTDERMTHVHAQMEWNVPNAHNAFLETTLNLGMVATFLVIVVWLTGMRHAGSRKIRQQDPAYAFVFGLGVFALVNAFFESYMLETFNFAPFLLACGFFRLAFFEETEALPPSPAGNLRLAGYAP